MRLAPGATVLTLALAALPADGARGVARRDPGAGLQVAAHHALERKMLELDAEEARLKAELESLGPSIAEARDRTLAHGRQFYRLTRAGLLPVGGGFDELVRHALRVERSRRALSTDVASERRLRERGGEIAREIERLGKDRSAFAAQRQAMEATRAAEEAESRRQQAFDRAFETSTGASNEYVAIYGGASSGASESRASGFAAARGRLLFPVAGRAEVRSARREGTDGPGLEVKAALGAPVRAVFAGRVAFADRYGPYGRIVILDHGDHYYTVSGNLAAFDVKVGDEVSAGERVGTVGDDGHGALLYFEVRHGTETVQPGPWLGL